MIQLKQLLTEGNKIIKMNFRKVLPGGIDSSRNVEFSVFTWSEPARFIFLPKTSKDLDKIDELNLRWEDVGVLIENRLNDQFKEVEFKHDRKYHGAGYGFVINYDKILNKIK